MVDQTMPVPPFTVGDVRYRACNPSEQVAKPCPICFGKKRVTVILGDDSRQDVECDACGIGFEGPRGFVVEYEQTARTEAVTITGLVSYREGEWRVRCSDGNDYDLVRLYVNEAQAQAQAEANVEALNAHNYDQRKRRRKGVSKLAWTVYYHRQRIADAKRQIAWHEAKLCQQKGAADVV